MRSQDLYIFPLLIVVMSLNGCFGALKPLFDTDKSAQPFQNVKIKDNNGVIGLAGNEYEYILVGKHYYDKKQYTDNKNKAVRYAVYSLSNDVYLVQSWPQKSQVQAYDFAVIKKSDDKILVFQTCTDLTQEFLDRYKITVSEDPLGGDPLCTFNNLEAVTALSNLPGIWESSSSSIEILSIN